MSDQSLTISGPAFYHAQNKVDDKMISNFREKFQIDSETFFLCYGGSSKGLNEIKHLEKLNNLLTIQKKRSKYSIDRILGKILIKMRNYLIKKILNTFT